MVGKPLSLLQPGSATQAVHWPGASAVHSIQATRPATSQRQRIGQKGEVRIASQCITFSEKSTHMNRLLPIFFAVIGVAFTLGTASAQVIPFIEIQG
jgi:hypothetical protein